MAEITVAADLDSLNDVLAFVDGEMERAGCSMKLMTQVDMAVEEIFVNIARYAYHPEAGEASVRCEAGGDPFQIVVGFADRGPGCDPGRGGAAAGRPGHPHGEKTDGRHPV